jgi:sugar (pentulose or hexulose) kinase
MQTGGRQLEFDDMNAKIIADGHTYLGIELGSTRIKAVLIGPDHQVLASGAHDWENKLENGYWTFSLEDAWAGVQDSFRKLAEKVWTSFGRELTTVGAMGVSAMMHGYLPFNSDGEPIARFRTWRNTTTEQAAEALTGLFQFNIPQRWSIAHLYQAMLNGEEHVKDISSLTTLAGYMHWQLTGKKVLGIGEASGMFPIDSDAGSFDSRMLNQFNSLLQEKGLLFKLEDILPKVLHAGELAGTLTMDGAKRLDPSGVLKPGIPLCPPEGDAGTGMVATNSIKPRTGNISAGTSVFAMAVLEKPLSKLHLEIDMVTTPAGMPVAMVHCNTCTSDLDAWVSLLGEMADAAGAKLTKAQLYDLFYQKALEGDADCGGLININYYSGEPVTGLTDGRPLFVRRPDAKLTLANFARVQLYSTVASLRLGMDILFEQENVQLDSLLGHGGLFKTPLVGQKMLAGALNTPVSVMETAGEGGPWGMALLAQFMQNKSEGQALEDYLSESVFVGTKGSMQKPDAEDVAGFNRFLNDYVSALAVEKTAVTAINMIKES